MTTHSTGLTPASSATPVHDLRDPGYQAFLLLRTVFTAAPILFGLDKLTNLLVQWDTYLAPWINDLVPGTGAQAMYVVGVVEVVAGLAVALAPRFGAWRVLHRHPTTVTVALLRCDAGEEVDRISSGHRAWLTYLADRDSNEH